MQLDYFYRYIKATVLITAGVLSGHTAMFAAGVDDIRNLVESGQYAAAIEAAAPLLKKTPRDAALNYWYGIASLNTGNQRTALTALNTAAERGYTDAYPELIEIDIADYNIAGAQANLSAWETALRKAKRSTPESFGQYQSRLLLMANQLERVEDIPVIARYNVSRDAFMTAINRLDSPDMEKGRIFLPGNIPFYINNFGREVFFTQPDTEGINRLFVAGVLDDGTREEPVELTKYVGDGDIVAPFLMEDGETLYFGVARDGESDDSLGGYDIYMTRRDGEGGFYEPSNIGMPYNSPGDDFLLILDEENNLGWWATDRFAPNDSVAILVFVPNESRRNIDIDDEFLAERAKVTDIKYTLPAKYDLASAKKRIPAPGSDMKNSATSAGFALSLGDGRVITSTSQLRNREAVSAMSEVIRTRKVLNDNIERLDSMRAAYASGNKSLRDDIRQLEKEVDRQQTELKTLTNRVIRLETNSR